MPLLHAVAKIEHRSERGGFAGTGRADDQDQATLFHHHLRQHLRQRQRTKLRNVGFDVADYRCATALLPHHVDAKIAHTFHRHGEIEFQLFFKSLDLMRFEDFVTDLFGVLGAHRLGIHRNGIAVDLDVNRRTGRDEQVGGFLLRHQFEKSG